MKRIAAIKNGLIKRNSSLVKHAFKAGINILGKTDTKEILEGVIGRDVKSFVDDLALFKGSVTKAGQLLSQYGEYYLPAEVNKKLKLLQNATHYLDFELISDQLNVEVSQDLEVDTNPIAAASIGQVHLATLKTEPQTKLILKIQYKGIEKAIKGDMLFLKMFIKGIKIFPSGVNATALFNEIESVLTNEMDYQRERNVIELYRQKLCDDYFYIPIVYPKYSNLKSICMEYIEGIHLSELKHTEDNQDKRNLLCAKIFELFLLEIFEFGYVQTDAHGGNYLVNEDLSRLTLIDFGACLKFDNNVLKFYQNFLKYSYLEDRKLFMLEVNKFVEFAGGDIHFNEEILWEYICMISLPLRSDNFHWGRTNLPDQIMEIAQRLRQNMKFNKIPHQFIFLDRKLFGVFTLLKSLDAQFDVKSIFKKTSNV